MTPKLKAGDCLVWNGDGLGFYTNGKTYRVLDVADAEIYVEDDFGSDTNRGKGHIWTEETMQGRLTPANADPVNRPAHYTGHPSGVECIQITEHMSFCRGNAMKYIWRAGDKGNEVQDLEKAIWYLQREIELIRKKTP